MNWRKSYFWSWTVTWLGDTNFFSIILSAVFSKTFTTICGTVIIPATTSNSRMGACVKVVEMVCIKGAASCKLQVNWRFPVIFFTNMVTPKFPITELVNWNSKKQGSLKQHWATHTSWFGLLWRNSSCEIVGKVQLDVLVALIIGISHFCIVNSFML